MADEFQAGQSGNPAGVPGYRALAKAERITLLREAAWVDIFNPALPPQVRHSIRADLLNREEGMPVARVVTTDDADKWFVEGVAEAKSVDEWTATHGLATAKPAGNAD
jgi:hypothetical protein